MRRFGFSLALSPICLTEALFEVFQEIHPFLWTRGSLTWYSYNSSQFEFIFVRQIQILDCGNITHLTHLSVYLLCNSIFLQTQLFVFPSSSSSQSSSSSWQWNSLNRDVLFQRRLLRNEPAPLSPPPTHQPTKHCQPQICRNILHFCHLKKHCVEIYLLVIYCNRLSTVQSVD